MIHEHKWIYVDKNGNQTIQYDLAETRRCTMCPEIHMKAVEWIRMVLATMPEKKDGD